MNRRKFLSLTAVSALAASAKPFRAHSFEFEEATISELQAAMISGRESAVSLATKYLERIEAVDRRGPAINSVIEVNPDALAIARERDRERKAGQPRGPL